MIATDREDSAKQFDIQKFYKAAHDGDVVDTSAFLTYARSFRHVVLWGAGNLGEKLGAKLLEMDVEISYYWDVRSHELVSLHGVTVQQPFSMDLDPENTLIIFCITNVFVAPTLKEDLKKTVYSNYLIGEDLYQGLICPFDKSNALDIKLCRDLPECNVCTCKKLDNLIDYHNMERSIAESYERLHFPNVTFVINQKCTLQCKYCYSYTNDYSQSQRINFDLDRIKTDIDRFFDAVDSVTLVPLIGGEPFLHPNISEIVQRISEKKNFGILNVTTNGVVKITEKMLETFHDDRCRVFFSNYTESLSQQQMDLFYRNIDFVRSQGVMTLVYNTTPQWTVPVTMNDKNFSHDTRVEMKKNCGTGLHTTAGKYVKNGYFYPCTIIDSVHSLEIGDYPQDRVRIDEFDDRNALRESIRRKMLEPCYTTCTHCGARGNLIAKAGEQGYQDFTGKALMNV